MNNYIQNKLDEFREKYPNMQSENDEYTAIPTVELIEQSLTDYHNQIVEMMHNQVDLMYEPTQWEHDTCVNFVNNFYERLSTYQDTNK